MTPEPTPDFFISRAGADAGFAAQIGHILEDAGYAVILQQWDFANRNFMERMHAALDSGARVIGLYSPAHFASEHCLAEALNALGHDPLNKRARFIAVRVAECTPPGLFTALAYWDLLQIRTNPALLKEIVLAAVKPGRQKTAQDAAAPYFKPARTILHPRIGHVPNFTGRVEDMRKIDAALLSGSGTTAITQAVTRGMGGVGKSTLAIEYAWVNRERYAGVWWLDAATEDPVKDGLIALGAIFIRGLDEVTDKRDEAVAKATRFLAEGGFEKPWLLIYDNIENTAAVQQLERVGAIPSAGAHVLITSRWRDWRGTKAAEVEIGLFTAEEAVDFLLARTGYSDRDGALQLAEDLGRLPLALDHAAAFCVDRAIGFAAYRSNLAAWLDEPLPPGLQEEARTVFATFSLAIKAAAAQAPEAETLMGLISHFGRAGIPEWLIPEAFDPMHRARGALARVSLITVTGAETQGAAEINVHPLVQAVMRARLGKAGTAAEVAAQATRLIYDGYDFYSGTVETQLRRAAWLPHALAVVEHGPRQGDAARQTVWAANFIGDFRVSRGELSAAKHAYDTGMDIVRGLAALDPGNAGWQRDLSVSHNKVGDVLVAQGDLSGALDAYRQSLRIRERLSATDPGNAWWQRDLSVSNERLGDIYMAQGNLAAALELYQASLGRMIPIRDRDPSNADLQRFTSVTYNKVGDVLVAQGDLSGALDAYKADLAIAERLAATDPGNAAWQRDLAINNERLGDIYMRQDNNTEAIAAFERALEAYRELLRRNPDDVQSELFSVVPLWRIGSLKGTDGAAELRGALAILKKFDEAGRLDANRKGWIAAIETRLKPLDGGDAYSDPARAQGAPDAAAPPARRGLLARLFRR